MTQKGLNTLCRRLRISYKGKDPSSSTAISNNVPAFYVGNILVWGPRWAEDTVDLHVESSHTAADLETALAHVLLRYDCGRDLIQVWWRGPEK